MKRIIWILAALFLGVYITRPISDPDIWWHLTIGKWILHHFRVPDVDQWNMFAVGKPWRAYSWSNEIVYALFERAWGISGIVLLHFLLGWAIALSLFYCLGKISKDWFLGVLLGTVVAAGLVEHFSLRPQSFTWVCLIWLLFFADKIYEEGLNKRNGFGIFIFMCLWANTHITTIFGLLVTLTWTFDSRRKQQSVWLAAILFCATLLTPYMGGEWLTFFSKVDHPLSFARITEFQPATLLHYSSGILVLLLGLLIALWQKALKAISLSKGALIGVFILAGFAVVKFIPIASILLAALIARVWREALSSSSGLGNYHEAYQRLSRFLEKFYGQGFAFLLLCLIVVEALGVLRNPINQMQVPVDAVSFIKTHQLPHPILNAFSEGGYLMYAFSRADGSAEHLVSIDGRTNLITKELWSNYSKALLGEENWQEYIKMVDPQTILWPQKSPFNTLLMVDAKWCRVFRSGDSEKGFSVFVQREFLNTNSELLRKGCI